MGEIRPPSNSALSSANSASPRFAEIQGTSPAIRLVRKRRFGFPHGMMKNRTLFRLGVGLVVLLVVLFLIVISWPQNPPKAAEIEKTRPQCTARIEITSLVRFLIKPGADLHRQARGLDRPKPRFSRGLEWQPAGNPPVLLRPASIRSETLQRPEGSGGIPAPPQSRQKVAGQSSNTLSRTEGELPRRSG